METYAIIDETGIIVRTFLSDNVNVALSVGDIISTTIEPNAYFKVAGFSKRLNINTMGSFLNVINVIHVTRSFKTEDVVGI